MLPCEADRFSWESQENPSTQAQKATCPILCSASVIYTGNHREVLCLYSKQYSSWRIWCYYSISFIWAGINFSEQNNSNGFCHLKRYFCLSPDWLWQDFDLWLTSLVVLFDFELLTFVDDGDWQMVQEFLEWLLFFKIFSTEDFADCVGNHLLWL